MTRSHYKIRYEDDDETPETDYERWLREQQGDLRDSSSPGSIDHSRPHDHHNPPPAPQYGEFVGKPIKHSSHNSHRGAGVWQGLLVIFFLSVFFALIHYDLKQYKRGKRIQGSSIRLE